MNITHENSPIAPPVRCAWCTSDPQYVAYHDHEWGVPQHDERKLFELLVLESAQAGLSWLTILRKRFAYRQSFADFDVERVACFGSDEVERLMQNSGIVRHRLKIESTIANARAVLDLRQEFNGLDEYLWHFTEGKVRVNAWQNARQIPAATALSDSLSKDMKRRGFRFIGSTTCYSLMQAMGMVNDHTTDCFCYPSPDRADGGLDLA